MELRKIYEEFGTGNLWPDMMLHVTDERPDDLKLIADFYRLARPEIIIEFMEEDGWWDAEHIESVKRHNLALNPRRAATSFPRGCPAGGLPIPV